MLHGISKEFVSYPWSRLFSGNKKTRSWARAYWLDRILGNGLPPPTNHDTQKDAGALQNRKYSSSSSSFYPVPPASRSMNTRKGIKRSKFRHYMVYWLKALVQAAVAVSAAQFGTKCLHICPWWNAANKVGYDCFVISSQRFFWNRVLLSLDNLCSRVARKKIQTLIQD